MLRSLREVRQPLEDYFPRFVQALEEGSQEHRAMSSALDTLEGGSLSWARLNQVMHLCHQAGMSDGFYSYYFLGNHENHPYPVERVFGSGPYRPPEEVREIKSLQQFQWGVRRFIVDAMLYWGNLRQAYRELRVFTRDVIADQFASKRMDENRMITRGSVIQPDHIPQDHRYLITEMACKTYEDQKSAESAAHVQLALQAFRELKEQGARVTPELLKTSTKELADRNNQRQLFELLFEECSEELQTEEAVLALYAGQYESFKKAREKALQNTQNYLSICNDLDVYVATSMRTRQDFREMATACDAIFKDKKLEKYSIRYFDPTLSAAEHHEDKGIIECLWSRRRRSCCTSLNIKRVLEKSANTRWL